MKRRTHMPAVRLTELDPAIKWIDDYDIINGLTISKGTLNKWHREGLPKYKWGKKIYYKLTELNECLEKHKKIHPSQTRKFNTQEPKK